MYSFDWHAVVCIILTTYIQVCVSITSIRTVSIHVHVHILHVYVHILQDLHRNAFDSCDCVDVLAAPRHIVTHAL